MHRTARAGIAGRTPIMPNMHAAMKKDADPPMKRSERDTRVTTGIQEPSKAVKPAPQRAPYDTPGIVSSPKSMSPTPPTVMSNDPLARDHTESRSSFEAFPPFRSRMAIARHETAIAISADSQAASERG